MPFTHVAYVLPAYLFSTFSFLFFFLNFINKLFKEINLAFELKIVMIFFKALG